MANGYWIFTLPLGGGPILKSPRWGVQFNPIWRVWIQALYCGIITPKFFRVKIKKRKHHLVSSRDLFQIEVPKMTVG